MTTKWPQNNHKETQNHHKETQNNHKVTHNNHRDTALLQRGTKSLQRDGKRLQRDILRFWEFWCSCKMRFNCVTSFVVVLCLFQSVVVLLYGIGGGPFTCLCPGAHCLIIRPCYQLVASSHREHLSKYCFVIFYWHLTTTIEIWNNGNLPQDVHVMLCIDARWRCCVCVFSRKRSVSPL